MSRPPLQPDYYLNPLSGHAPDSLVMLLHGVGASGADLISLAELWAPALPNTEFLSPNAPYPYDQAMMGEDAYQWFSLDGITPEVRTKRVQEAAPILNTFIDSQLDQRGLTDAQLILVGFSQGTIMALYTALRRPKPCAGILGYSGRLAGAETLGEELRSKPPIALIHGDQDAVIPLSEWTFATQVLESHGVPLVTHCISGLGHGINPEAIALGQAFLTHCFMPQMMDTAALKATYQ
jgi:phospholipase/carboxylesterase